MGELVTADEMKKIKDQNTGNASLVAQILSELKKAAELGKSFIEGNMRHIKKADLDQIKKLGYIVEKTKSHGRIWLDVDDYKATHKEQVPLADIELQKE